MSFFTDTTKQYTKDEYNARMIQLSEKVANQEKLTIEEKYFFSEHTSTEYLLHHEICIDEFYCRYYLDLNSIYANKKPLYKWNDRHHTYYESLVRDWENTILKKNHTDQLLKITSEETREQLKLLRKSKRKSIMPILLDQYLQERFITCAWSKFQYLIIKRTFELDIGKSQYTLYLNGKEIIYNYFSLVHIVTRHFGEPMKPYQSVKDHFHHTFYYDNIHLKLNEIFETIDESGLYCNQSVKKINFRFLGQLYKIFCEDFILGQKGVKTQVKLRLNSFFPVSNPSMIDRLNNKFQEERINNDLNIFLLK